MNGNYISARAGIKGYIGKMHHYTLDYRIIQTGKADRVGNFELFRRLPTSCNKAKEILEILFDRTGPLVASAEVEVSNYLEVY